MIPLGAKQTDLAKMDSQTLSAMVVGCLTHIEHLELMIAKLRRMHFGHRSEKNHPNDQQLDLELDGLEVSPDKPAEQEQTEGAAQKPPLRSSRKSRALPKRLRRETQTHLPEHENCPDCGGTMKKLGEDVSEMLEYIPASFFVIRHVRPKLSCSRCSCVVQAPAPSRPVDRGLPGPGLLAHVLTAKFADHLPLYRQSQMYAREGVELDRSVLARWVGEASELMTPLVEVLRRYVMSTDKLHGDDTPLPVLATGHGRTKTARFWTYVRDSRPAGDSAPAAAWFAYSPDRKGEHPQRHLAKFRGILQADAYSGFNKLYEGGLIQEAPCMAHIRRKFFELMDAHQSPIATEAVERIAALYQIEREIRGRPPEERREVRNARARSLLDSMRTWLKASLGRLPPKSETTSAIQYALARWEALVRYLDDGRIELDNLIAERALRPVAVGRRNYLFAGSDEGGSYCPSGYLLINRGSVDVDHEMAESGLGDSWLPFVPVRYATRPH